MLAVGLLSSTIISNTLKCEWHLYVKEKRKSEEGQESGSAREREREEKEKRKRGEKHIDYNTA